MLGQRHTEVRNIVQRSVSDVRSAVIFRASLEHALRKSRPNVIQRVGASAKV